MSDTFKIDYEQVYKFLLQEPPITGLLSVCFHESFSLQHPAPASSFCSFLFGIRLV